MSETTDKLLAAGSGLYIGVGDAVRIPAHLANKAGNVLGLRNDSEANSAANAIDDTFKPPKEMEEAGDKHPYIKGAAEFVPGLVAGQALLKTIPKASVIGSELYTKANSPVTEVFSNPKVQRGAAAGLSVIQDKIQDWIGKDARR